jgi:hypothetical protein
MSGTQHYSRHILSLNMETSESYIPQNRILYHSNVDTVHPQILCDCYDGKCGLRTEAPHFSQLTKYLPSSPYNILLHDTPNDEAHDCGVSQTARPLSCIMSSLKDNSAMDD